VNSYFSFLYAILLVNAGLVSSEISQGADLLEEGDLDFVATASIIDGEQIDLSWSWSEAGANFLVEYSSSLENPNWQNLTEYRIVENEGHYVASVEMGSGTAKGFYRVVAYTDPVEVIDLVSLDQLEDSSNIGKLIRINRSLDLQGQTIQIPAGVLLLPAGGVLSNGTIGGEGFTISTEARNRVFNQDLKFKVPYSQAFLPEWYGARADGATNDSLALALSIEASEKVELWAGRNYLLGDSVEVDRLGSVKIDGKRAKVITTGITNGYVFRFGVQFDLVDLKSVHIDGRNEVGSGIFVYNNFKGDDLDLRNFYNEEAEAVALHLEITKKAQVLLENSVVDHMKSPANGKIGDAIGASRAIRIYWRHTDPESVIQILNNTLTRAYGDDGDLIQIAQTNEIYDHSSQTVISGNYIAYGTRRLIKGTASNIVLSGNTFKAMELDHPEGEGVIKTYMLSFGPFNGNFGEDGDHVLGVIVKDNIIDNTLGYEGTLGLIQTDKAVVEDNTFLNGKLIFAQLNRDTLIRNNEFNDSTIEMGWNPTISGDVRVVDNYGTIETGGRIDPIYGFFIMHPGANLIDLTMQRNTITVVEDIEVSFLGFFHPKDDTQVGALKLLDNTLIRERGNRDYTRSDFIYSLVNFSENSEVRGNRIVTDQNNVSRGLYFFEVETPFLFEYSNNQNSFGEELLPISGTAF